MRSGIRGSVLSAVLLGSAIFLFAGQAAANPIAPIFWWGPAVPPTNSDFVSFHNATGPVLADDFRPAASSSVGTITWWGSRAGSPQWEVTFHGDGGGQPGFPFLAQQFLDAIAVDIGNGVFEYDTAWPQGPGVSLALEAGQEYWFSVANLADGWTWANPDPAGPTFGSQIFFAAQSVDGDPSPIPGPHDGPWLTLDGQNFAFRIFASSAPEPGSLALLGAGLAGLAIATCRAARSRARRRGIGIGHQIP